MKEKININDLYFGIRMPQMSYSSSREKNTLKTYNLFDFSRVKFSVARWRTMNDEDKKLITNPLGFCFGDTWGRTEFEWVVNTWPYKDDEKVENGEKVDVFQMYVEPNADLLMNMVNHVTTTSAKKYIAEERKR